MTNGSCACEGGRTSRTPQTNSGPFATATAWLAGVLLTIALGLPPPTSAGVDAPGAEATTSSLENRLKAASLFRFLGYVEWPASSRPERDFYVIGVIGAPDIAEELTTITTGRRVNERSVAVRRMAPTEPFDDVDELFVGTTDGAQLRAIAARARTKPVLMVTQADDGLARGSMVNFRVVDDRVRFEVSLDAVEQAGLRLSSRMLSVALQVSRSGPR